MKDHDMDNENYDENGVPLTFEEVMEILQDELESMEDEEYKSLRFD